MRESIVPSPEVVKNEIMEVLSDAKLSPFEAIGILEYCKEDIIASFLRVEPDTASEFANAIDGKND